MPISKGLPKLSKDSTGSRHLFIFWRNGLEEKKRGGAPIKLATRKSHAFETRHSLPQYAFIFSLYCYWKTMGKGKGRQHRQREVGQGKRNCQRAFWVDAMVESQHEKCSVNICWMTLPKTKGCYPDILNACGSEGCGSFSRSAILTFWGRKLFATEAVLYI